MFLFGIIAMMWLMLFIAAISIVFLLKSKFRSYTIAIFLFEIAVFMLLPYIIIYWGEWFSQPACLPDNGCMNEDYLTPIGIRVFYLAIIVWVITFLSKLWSKRHRKERL